jgi:hypothetical protein
MNKTNYILLSIVFFVSFLLIFNTLSFDAQTGDEKLDKKLNEINARAITNIDEFKSQIALKYQTSESEVARLLKIMEPAEILFSYEISAVSSTPIEEIIETYKNNKNEGWEIIISEIGIEKNSKKFKELKNLSIYNDQTIDDSSLSQNK